MNAAGNRTALVTGAAKGVGRAIALELAASGFDIVVHYHTSHDEARKTAEEIEALGRRAYLAEFDLAHLHLVEKLLPALTEGIGLLAALVNNASIFIPDRAVSDKNAHTIINAEAPRVLSEAFRKQAVNGGAIVNILDADPSAPEFSFYNTSKKELEAMTLEMAGRFAPAVRVNGIALGHVLRNPRQSEEHFEKLVEATPLGKAVPPQQVAAAVRFAIENEALTGAIIPVDGGLHLAGKSG